MEQNITDWIENFELEELSSAEREQVLQLLSTEEYNALRQTHLWMKERHNKEAKANFDLDKSKKIFLQKIAATPNTRKIIWYNKTIKFWQAAAASFLLLIIGIGAAYRLFISELTTDKNGIVVVPKSEVKLVHDTVYVHEEKLNTNSEERIVKSSKRNFKSNIFIERNPKRDSPIRNSTVVMLEDQPLGVTGLREAKKTTVDADGVALQNDVTVQNFRFVKM